MSIAQLLVGGAAGGGVVAFFAWLLRESIKASLKREVSAHTEYLKHDLQREMLKAQLSTAQVHTIYPRLMEKLRRAEGAVAGPMGLQFKPSYDDYDIEDFTEVVKGLKLPGAERERLLELLQSSRREGVQELQKVARRIELWRGQGSVGRAKNYAVLKSLYLSTPVRTATWEAIRKLNEVWIYSQPEAADYLKAAAAVEASGKLLEALENLMRAELSPSPREGAEKRPSE